MHRVTIFGALFLVAVCSSVAVGDADRAVRRIRNLLEEKKIDRGLFPEDAFNPRSFDPQRFDPMMLEAIWERVRPAIRRIIEQETGAELYDDSLKLYVGEVSSASSTSYGGPTVVSSEYTILFVEYDRVVRDVLMRALELPEECFSRQKRVMETRTVSAAQLSVSWNSIGHRTSQFVSSSPSIRRFGFVPQAPQYFGDKVQLVTSWRQYTRLGGYDLFWRLFFQVKRTEQESVYLVTVRGQVARNLPGRSINRIEYLGSEEFDSRFEVPVGSEHVYRVEKYVPDGPSSGPVPQEPMQVSTSGQLVKSLLDEYYSVLTE